MRACVIGAGLGGMLTAAKLCKMGCDVEVFEQLPFIGGRFTNIEYRGYQLTTGALHMIPHGKSGPLSTLLSDVGADVDIIPSHPATTIRIPDGDSFEDVQFGELVSRLSFWNRLMYKLLILEARLSRAGNNYSFKYWISRRLHDEAALNFADAFCGWALSVTSEQITAKEGVAIIKNIYRRGGSGIPVGGCKAVIDALSEVIKKSNGKIYTNHKVEKIILENDVIKSICVKNKNLAYDVIISNLGHIETQKLIHTIGSENHTATKEYKNKLASIVPSAGIKINIASDTPLIDHTGVLLTPYTKRINGLNQVTNADPTLAPQGKHLIMAHMAVRSSDLEREARLGLEDLKTILHGINYEVLMVQTYHSKWPVNRCISGRDIGNTTPYKHLYVVGDGAKGCGGIEVDGIALGVENTVKEIMELQSTSFV
ncbi:MAG: Flavin containing amine oxidoreductase [Candidatus Argoarchaeum ethanivorans]|uniref:Flavin containing amine oxidoreductase n=1 Tax=Candidatus Argoarchaeum ethanivorans TaxID=2608793 RepID=A0A811TAI4_9EURY|nr:MAG: Flavin containing amine oxidoreductase [Candidatus Argoarchaeum ethanivorans]